MRGKGATMIIKVEREVVVEATTMERASQRSKL